jgi:three-Cys-motif partner protein
MESLHDDGLVTPIVGPWAEEKYRLVECYARIFATAMKRKWDVRVYVDLFSGPGRARIRGSQRTVETAALRVLSIPDPFDRYIFCELDPQKMAALQSRIATSHPRTDTECLQIDSNADVERVVSAIPAYSKGTKVLTFCFVDPFKASHLDFSTIRRLAKLFVDFLVLIPTGMDPGRNEERYSNQSNAVVARFTGRERWRAERMSEPRVPFGDFVAAEFARNMADLGYLSMSLADMHEMRNSKNRGMYRLAMFSRNRLGIDFWEACRESTSPQTSLF